jgi:DNA primase
MIDLTGIDLTALIEREGVTLRRAAPTEWHGPCPACGGRDRFAVWTHDGRQFWRCRECHTKPGDAIAYVRWRNPSMGFRDACEALRVTPATGARPQPVARPYVPIDAKPADWRENMAAFAAACARALWAPAAGPVLRYLRHERGLTDDTIRAYGIGYNPESRKIAGQWWAWRGVTLPRWYCGDVWAVNVRRTRADIDADGGQGKYKLVTGSTPAQLFNADTLITPGLRDRIHTVIVTGGEFDTLAVMQCAPAGVHAVTLGGESATPSPEVRAALGGFDVLICLDADEAGEAGAAKWLAALPGARRIVSPVGKDLSDFLTSGADVSAWLAGQIRYDVPGIEASIDWLAQNNYEPSCAADGRLLAGQVA